MGRACCLQAAVVEKPEEPHGVGGFERVSYSNPLGRRSVTPQAQVRAPALVSSAAQGLGHSHHLFARSERLRKQETKVPCCWIREPQKSEWLGNISRCPKCECSAQWRH